MRCLRERISASHVGQCPVGFSSNMLKHWLQTNAMLTDLPLSKDRARKSTSLIAGKFSLLRQDRGGKNTLKRTSVRALFACAAPLSGFSLQKESKRAVANQKEETIGTRWIRLRLTKNSPPVRSHVCSRNALDAFMPSQRRKHPSTTIWCFTDAKAQFIIAL